ncbi:hypothetical protein [Bacteroides cellulosilyticus]|jgi:hypothetical protein|uniref:hypothetical protein n=1 Tax=Bacteroides cellulosilyticus TaxID=246787 RepID=UPI00205A4B7C|nr:MAG TPA: hypothetical protein [Caudoviricetes sp.]
MIKIIAFLVLACIISCSTNKKERNLLGGNDFMDANELGGYQNYNDSLSSLEKTSNKKIFLDIHLGESKKKVTDKLFAAVEKKLLEYDTENWYLTHTYKDSKFKFVIDCSYYNDSLYEMAFKGESIKPAESSVYDIKMALLDCFKTELKGGKKLKSEGRYYHDMLKYDGSIQYNLSGNSFYINDMALNKRLIDSIDPDLRQSTIDALSIDN